MSLIEESGERILEALRAAPEGLTPRELAADLQMRREHVDETLERLRHRGLVFLRSDHRRDSAGWLAYRVAGRSPR